MHNELEPENYSGIEERSSHDSVRAFTGCFIGALAGPCLFFLGLYVVAWLFPNAEAGGWLIMLAALVLSVPCGAIAGALLTIIAPRILTLIKQKRNR